MPPSVCADSCRLARIHPRRARGTGQISLAPGGGRRYTGHQTSRRFAPPVEWRAGAANRLAASSTRFTAVSLSTNSDHQTLLARRAAHPNAAKLLAAVLAGPEGQRIQAESTGVGRRYYETSSDR